MSDKKLNSGFIWYVINKIKEDVKNSKEFDLDLGLDDKYDMIIGHMLKFFETTDELPEIDTLLRS